MDIPKTMKVFTIPTRSVYINPDPVSSITLHPSHPIPTPKADEALLRVHAAAITPFELTWPNSFAPQPRVPCHDASGTVISAPSGSTFSPGDEVFSLLAFTGQGALAEYAVVEPRFLARIPEGMGFVEAASLPRAGLTVLQALNVGREGGWLVGDGRRVLITGATGAVGRMGVQIFKDAVGENGWVGAVGGKGSQGLKELGADFVVSYREEKKWERLVERESLVDFVFDCVGGEALERCLGLVRDGGVVVSVASPPPKWVELKGWKEAEGRGVKGHFYIVDETGEGLDEIARLVKRGVIRPSVSVVVDGLTEDGVRYGWTKGQQGGLSGSVVVKIL